MRENGIENLADAKAVTMESGGEISVIPYDRRRARPLESAADKTTG